MLEISNKTNLLEQKSYKYSLQNVENPNLLRDIYTEGEEVAPTCTEYGYSAMKVCKRCGEVVKQSEQIEPLGHTVEIIPGVPATCTEDGLTEGKYCTVCGETLESQQIPAVLDDR